MELAPLMGIGLALSAAAVQYAGRVADVGNLLAAALAVTTLALLTRGLHLDGLADLTDGLASYRDPEGTRAVMRAPDTGPLGVAAVVLVLLVQAAALSSCLQDHRGTASLVLAVVVGRLAITAACVYVPAATADGLGALVAGTVRRGVALAWTAGVTLAAGAYARVDPEALGGADRRTVQAVLAVGAGLTVAWLLRRHAVRRVGGLTGDVLGAVCEVATTVALVVLAASSS